MWQVTLSLEHGPSIVNGTKGPTAGRGRKLHRRWPTRITRKAPCYSPAEEDIKHRLTRISHGPVRNAQECRHSSGLVSRESFRPGKLLPKQLATGDLLTNRKVCEKVRLNVVRFKLSHYTFSSTRRRSTCACRRDTLTTGRVKRLSLWKLVEIQEGRLP